MTPNSLNAQPRVVYEPPADSLIEEFADEACRTLGPGYDDPNVIDGLAGFLKAIAKAYAHILTREGGMSVDSSSH